MEDIAPITSEQCLAFALKKIEQLEKEVILLKNKATIAESGLSAELLKENGMLIPEPERRIRGGRGARPLLREEIEAANLKSTNAHMAARILEVSFSTYQKYAKLYGNYQPNRNGQRKSNYPDPNVGRYPLSEILQNKFPDIDDFKVRDKLIRSKFMEPKCNICGYCERRLTDDKIPLLLDHKDGNKQNFLIDNLQILCYNCTFICGRGFIRGGNNKFDSDWIEGATQAEISKKSRW